MVKIGFGNVVSQVVLFMSVMVVIVVLSMTYKTYISTTNVSLRAQHENVLARIDTSFLISSAGYDNGTLNLMIENNGALKLDPEKFDFIIDSERIPRQLSDRTYLIVPEFNLENSNHLDPGERMTVSITRTLSSGKHLVRVSSENGAVRSKIFDA